MRIGIVTIQSDNIGNRLQNYALQDVLVQRGYEVETLKRTGGLFEGLKRGIRPLLKRDAVTKCRSFSKRYINWSPLTLSPQRISYGLSDRYDLFIIGSDQVWNPNFAFTSDLDYLPFVSREKKIAYAASFGIERLPHGQERIAGFLNDIRKLSVREHAGARIVYELTGREAPVVLDPTMLLSASQWRGLMAKPVLPGIEEDYAFIYTLGRDATASDAVNHSLSLGLPYIDWSSCADQVGPQEFLWLIDHAAMVFTNSFHGSVFSTLMKRPFVILEREAAREDESMSSRLDTLCELLGLHAHRLCACDASMEEFMSPEWSNVDEKLAAEREFSMNWLRGAVGADSFADE